MKKRIITMLLAVAMVFSAMTTAYASNESGVKPRGVFGASLILLSHEQSGSSSGWDAIHLGHACIMVFNHSSYPIEVGYMTVAPNDYVSLGLFGTKATPDHAGVWYNIEAASINSVMGLDASKYAMAACDITQSGLMAINNCIKRNSDHYDTIAYNCTHFARECWNAAVPSNLYINTPILSTPAILKNSIKNLRLPMPQFPPQKSIGTVCYRGANGMVYADPFLENATYDLLFA